MGGRFRRALNGLAFGLFGAIVVTGKAAFVMQLCKELAKFGRVAYDSLEEGASLTMQNTLRRFNMAEVNRRFQLLDCEPMSELGERMDNIKAPIFTSLTVSNTPK